MLVMWLLVGLLVCLCLGRESPVPMQANVPSSKRRPYPRKKDLEMLRKHWESSESLGRLDWKLYIYYLTQSKSDLFPFPRYLHGFEKLSHSL